MSLLEERFLYKEPSSPIGRTQLGLAASIVTPSPKKIDGNGDQAADDKPFIDHQGEEAIEHNGCNRCFEQWSKSKKNGWKWRLSRQ
jgi:hypothetical protein